MNQQIKNIRAGISARMHEYHTRWQRLPVKRQRRYLLYLFIAYTVLTVVVLITVVTGMGNSGKQITIDRILNPVLLQHGAPPVTVDSNRLIFKNPIPVSTGE